MAGQSTGPQSIITRSHSTSLETYRYLKTASADMELQVHNFCDASKSRQDAGADGKTLQVLLPWGVSFLLILLSLLLTLQPSPDLRARRFGQGMSRTERFDQGKENLFLQRLKSSLGERILLQGMTLHLQRAEPKIIHTLQNFQGHFSRQG